MDSADSEGKIVFLRSNDSMDMYHKNRISSFTNALQSPLDVRGEYMVGLRSIGYHKAWGNIQKRGGIEMEVEIITNPPLDKAVNKKKFFLPEGHYKNINQVFDSILALSPLIGEYRLKKIIDFELNKKSKKYSLKIKRKYREVIRTIRIRVIGDEEESVSLDKILGLGKGGKGLVEIEITPDSYFVSPTAPDFSNEYDTFFIHTPALINNVEVKRKLVPLIASIPVAGRGSFGEYLHYEMPLINYHRCAKERINSMTVEVKDASDALIAFQDYTGPTVLCFHFRKFNALNLELRSIFTSFRAFKQEFLYLSSSGSKDIYENNKPWNFTSQLICPFEITGSWECALCEVRYKRPAPELSTRSCMTIHIKKAATSIQSFKLIIEPGTFLSPADIVNKWNSLDIEISSYKGQLRRICELDFLEGSGRFVVSLVSREAHDIEKIHIDFNSGGNKDFAYFSGLVVDETDTCEITLSHDKPSFLFKAPPDLQQHTFNLWITAPDLVNETLVGSVCMNLLDVIPITGEFNTYQHYVYENRHYKPLKHNVVDVKTIRVCIKNSIGEYVPLSETDDVMVLLHFKKIVN